WREQIVLPDNAEPGGLSAGLGGDETPFNTAAVESHFGVASIPELGKNDFDSFADILGGDLAGTSFIGAGTGTQSFDPELLVEGIPGLDSTPGEDMGNPVLIVEGAPGDL